MLVWNFLCQSTSVSLFRTKPTFAVDHGTSTDDIISMMTWSSLGLTVFSHLAVTECARKCHGFQNVVKTTMDETVKVKMTKYLAKWFPVCFCLHLYVIEFHWNIFTSTCNLKKEMKSTLHIISFIKVATKIICRLSGIWPGHPSVSALPPSLCD